MHTHTLYTLLYTHHHHYTAATHRRCPSPTRHLRLSIYLYISLAPRICTHDVVVVGISVVVRSAKAYRLYNTGLFERNSQRNYFQLCGVL